MVSPLQSLIRKMRKEINYPRILMLSCSLDFQRKDYMLSSLDLLLQQEEEYTAVSCFFFFY